VTPEDLLRGVDPLAASAYVTAGSACSFLAAAVVVAGAVLLPLLKGAGEPVGSPLHPEYTPTRGSTRR
jgi:hypothetical protein